MNTEHPKYNAFLEDVKDALYYAWNAPLLDDDGGNDFIIKSAKLHLSFSRKYRMVCKQDGRDAKDSVDIIGVPNAKKDLCNEITFSKDLATGGVVRYECIEYNKKMKYGERVEEIEPRHTNVLFDKHDDGSLPISQVVTLKIPPCFVKY